MNIRLAMDIATLEAIVEEWIDTNGEIWGDKEIDFAVLDSYLQSFIYNDISKTKWDSAIRIWLEIVREASNHFKKVNEIEVDLPSTEFSKLTALSYYELFLYALLHGSFKALKELI